MTDIISLPTSGCDVWKIMALMLFPEDKKTQSNWIKNGLYTKKSMATRKRVSELVKKLVRSVVAH